MSYQLILIIIFGAVAAFLILIEYISARSFRELIDKINKESSLDISNIESSLLDNDIKKNEK